MTLAPIQLLKKAFAESWLRNPTNAFAAALEVTNNDPVAATQIANSWVGDQEVREFKEALIAEYGEEYFLPSKASMLHDILDRARRCPHADDYAKLMKLAADMRGFIEKPGVTVNNNTTYTTNKVMQIPVFVNNAGQPIDDHEWERQLIANQERLTNR